MYLIELTGGLIEVEAVDKSQAEKIFDALVAPLAEHGTLGFIGPQTEVEYEGCNAREADGHAKD